MAYSFAIEQAIRAATVLHKDQVKMGQVPYPYITHLFAVAMIVSDYTTDENTIVASLLHDTLEDTDYSEKELEDDFGGGVRDIVVSISEETPQSTDKSTKNAQRKEYLKKLKKAPENGLIILAAEKMHHMRNVVEEFYENHSEFIAHFGTDIEDTLYLYQEISNTLNRNLKNDILAEFNTIFTEYKNFIHDVEKKRNEY